MLNKKSIKDERITQIKHKITNEAFGLMFLYLVSVIFIKSVVFHIPTTEFITEFVLFIGISFYVVIRMVVLGAYAQNIRNSTSKKKLVTVIASDIFFILSMSIIQYYQGSFNILFLIFMAVLFFIAFYFILSITDKVTKRQINSKDDDE